MSEVFGALVDRSALEAWLPPAGMTGRFERFEPHAGGSYRLVLTYTDSTEPHGKSAADTDIVEARFVEVSPDDRVVQQVDFVSDAPEYAGTMTMTWAVRSISPGRTRVEIIATDVPDAISVDDHAAGLASSLENLADFLEH